MLAKDARFDGRFFVGVTTTRIYCRPVCPVPPPKVENARFFPSAAAAGEAGFRPCLRCRPETAVGTPAWHGTSATVTRALRMIADGAIDRGGVEDLAAPLGVTSRHLARLFMQHVGASPLAVARTRRLHFAKRLIDDSDLSMSEVALSAGFGSVRTFNAVFRKTYGKTPTQLRGKAASVTVNEGDVELVLSCRSPFEWRGLIGFLGARATPGVERVVSDSYERTIGIAGMSGSIAVRPSCEHPDRLRLKVRFPDPTELLRIAERVRRIFDVDADVAEITRHLGKDPLLAAEVRARPGLRVPGAWDGFELAVRAILGQQVSVKAATTLAGRLARTIGEPLARPSRGLSHLFPTAERLAAADLSTLGLTRARAATLVNLSRAVLDGAVLFGAGVDPVQGVRRLMEVRGIGAWTAQYVAMRAFGDPDAFPAGDLGLLRAAGRDGSALSSAELSRCAEGWRPWRAYAAMHLWNLHGKIATGAPRKRARRGTTAGGGESRRFRHAI